MKSITLMLGALALSASAAMADSHAVRMGTEGAYPPYNFINDAGEVDGYEREVGDEICKRAGLACTWVTSDWDGIIPNLVAGNYDTIIAGMSITDERDEVIDFTQEYFPPDPTVYVTLADADVDFDKGVIAAQASTIQASYIAGSDATLVEFATPDDTIAAVRNGEADAVFADRAFLDDIVKQSNGELVIAGPEVAIGGGVGIGVRESDGELKAKLDAAITSMKADGTLSAMIEKWFEGRKVTW